MDGISRRYASIRKKIATSRINIKQGKTLEVSLTQEDKEFLKGKDNILIHYQQICETAHLDAAI